MITKIKELLAVQEEIEKISKQTQEHSKVVTDFSTSLQGMTKEIEEVRKNHSEHLKELEKNVAQFQDLKESLHNEIYDFTLLKNKLHRDLIQTFEKELQKELEINVETLRQEFKEYVDIKQDLKDIRKDIHAEFTKLRSEMKKFREISAHIKKGDYDLSKYAAELRKTDGEKLRMVRKLDKMEDLVAKMRRSRR